MSKLINLSGGEWISAYEAASRLFPDAEKQELCNYAKKIRSAAAKQKITRRQGDVPKPLYVEWGSVKSYFEDSLPIHRAM